MGFSLFALSYGAILPTTTITIYATLYLLIAGVFKVVHLPVAKLINIKLATAVILITLCIADLSLRYLIKPADCLNYVEQNGALYYRTPTLQQQFDFLRLVHTPYKNHGLHTRIPNSTYIESKTEFKYTYTYNALGLRGDNFLMQKPVNTIRIITLGDSFTEGIGAPADSSWPVLLRQLLVQSSDTNYEVLNAGSSGSDPYFEIDLLKRRLLSYKPDVVIVAINSSDITEVAARGGYERFSTDSTVNIKSGPCWEPLYGASIIFRLVIHRVLHYNQSLIKLKEVDAVNNKAIALIDQAIDSMQQIAVANNFELVVVYHPLLRELREKHNSFAKSIKQTQANGIHCINLFEAYSNYFSQTNTAPNTFYWPVDAHHNSAGYLLYSRLVHAEMSRHKKTGKHTLPPGNN